MKTPQTIVEKIWNAHVVSETPGHPEVFAIDLMLIHEVTSAQAFQMLRERNLEIADRGRLLATLDHSIPTRVNRLEIFDEAARTQVATLRKNCEEWGVPICDFESGRQGIVHVIGPEVGVTQPGMTICCGDSHTSTHGAFGALAFGVGTSEVGHVLATGCLLMRRPKTMRVVFTGSLRKGVYAKDAILRLIAEIGVGGANGHVIEYAGDAIERMGMEERMTICNMSIECGARAGLVAPDETTFAYIQGRPYAPKPERWDAAVEFWRSLRSDPGATFDREVVIDLATLDPMVTWGTNPSQATSVFGHVPRSEELNEAGVREAQRALEYVKLELGSPLAGVPIEWAFLGSCTNGRIEDLRLAAQILKGRRIHPQVTMYVVPGSESVRAQAIEEGLAQIFTDAGADFRMPGCSMCLGMNDDSYLRESGV